MKNKDKNRNKNSSIHTLNADKNLNRIQKKIYNFLNRINNLFPNTNLDNDLDIRNFVCDDFKKYWPEIGRKNSPSRILSDLFWLKLPWNDIKEELEKINVFDTGCGAGGYGKKLIHDSNNNIANYTGVDINEHDNWSKIKEKFPNFKFHCFNGSDVYPYVPEGTNFFMTQSALEHFDADLSYFEQIRNYILSYKKTVFQIHLLPSEAGFRLFPYHGVRQYSPRTISKITRLFKGFSYSVLFKLGGENCNRLHWEFITKPLCVQKIGDMRESKTEEYGEKLLASLEQDMKFPGKFPAFYALLIHSNWKKKIIT